jgi:hypothetical protein
MSIREIFRDFLLVRPSLTQPVREWGWSRLQRGEVVDRWPVDDERRWLKELEWPLEEQKIDLLRQCQRPPGQACKGKLAWISECCVPLYGPLRSTSPISWSVLPRCRSSTAYISSQKASSLTKSVPMYSAPACSIISKQLVDGLIEDGKTFWRMPTSPRG